MLWAEIGAVVLEKNFVEHLVEICEVVHEKNKMSNTNNIVNDGQIVLLLKWAKKVFFLFEYKLDAYICKLIQSCLQS